MTFLSALFGIFFGIFQSHSRFGEHESVSWPLWISFSITIYRISLSICLNLKYVLKFLFLPMIFKCALRIQWRCTALLARHGCCHCTMFTKVISKVKRKQRPLWQVEHEPSKSGPVFMLKLVDFLVIETNVFNKSSSIFCNSYFYSIKCWSHCSKKHSMKNGQFQWVQKSKSYYLTKIWILWDGISFFEKSKAFCFSILFVIWHF